MILTAAIILVTETGARATRPKTGYNTERSASMLLKIRILVGKFALCAARITEKWSTKTELTIYGSQFEANNSKQENELSRQHGKQLNSFHTFIQVDR